MLGGRYVLGISSVGGYWGKFFFFMCGFEYYFLFFGNWESIIL